MKILLIATLISFVALNINAQDKNEEIKSDLANAIIAKYCPK